jgi:hypothetical protein
VRLVGLRKVMSIEVCRLRWRGGGGLLGLGERRGGGEGEDGEGGRGLRTGGRVAVCIGDDDDDDERRDVDVVWFSSLFCVGLEFFLSGGLVGLR